MGLSGNLHIKSDGLVGELMAENYPRSVTRMKAHTDPSWAIDRILDLESEVERLRAAYERDCATLRIVTLVEALTDLLDWAENIEGEGRLRRTEALAKARSALDA